MAKESYYLPVETVPVPGHGHANFQGIDIEIPNAPFLPDRIGGLSSVGIETENIPQNPEHSLRKISPLHGRSYEYSGGQKIVWADEYGNIFTTLNTKGNNATNPSFYLDRSSEVGFNILGLQTSVGIARQLRASKILRQKGIETEAITHVIEPLALPFNGDFVPIEKFKLKLKEDLMKRVNSNSKEGNVLLTQSLANVAFFETVRATQANERIADFATMPESERMKALENAFYYTNLYEKAQGKKDPSYNPLFFDISNPESIESYFNSYLPSKIGRNYAKLHSLGLVHMFSNCSNVSLAGSIVDLDSIQGEALGDNPEDIDYVQDLNTFKESVINSHQDSPFIPDLNLFIANLTNSYIQQAMQSTQQIDIHLKNIQSVIQSSDLTNIDPSILSPDSHHEYLEYMLEKAPMPSVDVEKIAKLIADQTYYDQRGSELTMSDKFIIFKEILSRLTETGYDKTLRRKLTKYNYIKAALNVLGGHVEDEKPEEIYKEVTSRKTQKVIDQYKEPLQDIFGTSESDGFIPRGHDQAYAKAAYQIVEERKWDQDIANNAFDIHHLLELGVKRTSNDEIRDSILDNILASFTLQTGISFPWHEKVSDLISEFHAFDQQQALDLQRISDDFKTKRPSQLNSSDMNSYVELQKYFDEKIAQDRYINFVVSKIDQWSGILKFRQALFDACGNSENANTINGWFSSQAGRSPIDTLPKEKFKKIDSSARKRMSSLDFGEKVDKKVLRRRMLR